MEEPAPSEAEGAWPDPMWPGTVSARGLPVQSLRTAEVSLRPTWLQEVCGGTWRRKQGFRELELGVRSSYGA